MAMPVTSMDEAALELERGRAALRFLHVAAWVVLAVGVAGFLAALVVEAVRDTGADASVAALGLGWALGGTLGLALVRVLRGMHAGIAAALHQVGMGPDGKGRVGR